MAEEQYIQELLTTGLGTEGSLLIPKTIVDTLVEEVGKKLIPLSEAAYYYGPEQISGSSCDVDLETPNSMKVRLVPEGAAVPIDNSDYSSFNLKPKKYGVAIKITRELMEDAKWNILERQIRIAGKRFAENLNSLIVSDALDQAANTVSGGAAVTIANLTRGGQYLRDADYDPTTLFIGNEVLTDLQNIDTFVEWEKVGNRDMLAKGFLGVIYGMDVILVSSNAGFTTTTAYITDRMHAFVIAEKRRLTVENFEVPLNDMSGAVLTHRVAVRHLRSDAIAKITSS